MSASILNGLSPTVAGNESEVLVVSGTAQGQTGAEFLASFNTQMHKQGQAQSTADVGALPFQQGAALEQIAGLLGEQDRQSVATLLGKALPSIQKNRQMQDIDLDETMIALQDILGNLGAVEAETNAVLQNLAGTVLEPLGDMEALVTSVAGKVKATDTTGIEETIDDISEALLVPIANLIAPLQIPAHVADMQSVADNATPVIPQMLKQETEGLAKKPTAQAAFMDAEMNEPLEPIVGSSHIMRENSLNTSRQLVDAVVDNISAKVADLPTVATQAVGEQAGQKFSTADLSTLNRQVENATPKQELPAMTKAFNHPEWKQEFNERIVWMHNKAIPSAEIRLNPQHLGPISIKINLDKDQQANILFHAHNAGVREAIEAALPKLKDMLGAQQVTLAEASVSQQGQDQGNARQAMQDALQDRKQNNSHHSLAPELGELDVNDMAEEITQGRAVASKGLLSLYA